MRILITICFLACFVLLGFNVLRVNPSGKGPVPKAEIFARHIQSGDYRLAVEDFGVNTCRCPGSLGWVSYLVYQSNEAQNLAFAVGHPFTTGTVEAHKIATTAKPTTFMDNPEDWEVNVPVSFNPDLYAPLFLPLDLAYGYDISEEALNAFIKDPDKDAWKGLCLRLRPTLASGAVDLPAAAKALEKPGHDSASIEKAVTGGENPDAEAIAKNLFGEEAVKYLHPKNPGKVLRQDKSQIPIAELTNKLPRLVSFQLKLHMVRRDQRLPYSVFQFLVLDPVLYLPESKSTVALKNFLPPVYSEATDKPKAEAAKD
ncbi:MAG: hypothetical protein QG625_4656 [Cyanobacteriota bacterium erpe_2018_sw_39hr_WHONDRS-SW48-000098_B_bin.30]|jgi:hypothetical protein|nr:hypothetical protein [Candidatus Obscuribacter sp.]MDQ5968499.1 hypothetical protein [Cyanobacteriota bacterium erpe_2018_sw_39hr_WHONDRS-SW48-000098_B_bin.30]